MTDWLDHAQLVTERAREVSVRAVQRVARVLEAPRPSARCCDCDDPIERERMEAAPGAQRCLFCQEAHERLFRNPALR